MKINWDAEIKGFDGDVLKDGKGKTLTLGFVALQALDAQLEEDKGISKDTKEDRFELMERIAANGDVEKAEAKFVRDRIGSAVVSLWLSGVCVTILKKALAATEANGDVSEFDSRNTSPKAKAKAG